VVCNVKPVSEPHRLTSPCRAEARTYLPITFHGKRFWPTLVTRAWEEVRCASLTGLHVSDSVEGRRPAIDSIV
jgi:hypothetical protein